MEIITYILRGSFRIRCLAMAWWEWFYLRIPNSAVQPQSANLPDACAFAYVGGARKQAQTGELGGEIFGSSTAAVDTVDGVIGRSA